MQFGYSGEHTVLIKPYNGNKTYNLWDDFALIPTSRLFIALPNPQFSFIQIPSSGSIIDFSERRIGQLLYSHCQGEWEFIINHNRWKNSNYAINSFEERINAKYSEVKLSDNPNEVYEGRVYIQGASSGSDYTTLTLAYILKPVT